MHVRPQTQVDIAFVITGTTLIDGRGGDARASTSVLIDAGRIAWIGPDENAPSIGDRPSIDAHGRALIPGLINSHGYFANEGSTDHSDHEAANVATAANTAGGGQVRTLPATASTHCWAVSSVMVPCVVRRSTLTTNVPAAVFPEYSKRLL